MDNKDSPVHSEKTYAEALRNNPFHPLSDNDDDDESMADVSSESLDATPKTDNAMTSTTLGEDTKEGYNPPMSHKVRRKAAKEAKKRSSNQEDHLSKEARVALKKARKAEEALQTDTANKPIANDPVSNDTRTENSLESYKSGRKAYLSKHP
jgi:hypothetical protein